MNVCAGHVLIVDNEPSVCSLIEGELSEHGFRCSTTSDPRRAKALLAGQAFDVLIADIAMPHLGGIELLAEVRDRRPQCKVVLMTGVSNRHWVSQALLLGAYDYIEKPFQSSQLLKVVGGAAGGRADRPVLHERAAAALEHSARVRQLALDSVRALVQAVEAKDPHTRRHSEQVAHYAVHLAHALGLSDPAIESLRVAGLLHDIGKIGVPDHILTKPGPLTEEELAYIRRHPALGADILANITLFGAEAQLVRHHHERWDGQGYPDGLTGEESPLPSRILQVADSIDAMLMERVYKSGYSVDRMIGELIRCAGTQFDPRIAAAAVQWCRVNPDKLVLPGCPAELVESRA